MATMTPEIKERALKAMEKLPPMLRDALMRRDPDVVGALLGHVAIVEKDYPSKGFIPNIGQERAMRCLAKPHPTYYKGYPHKVFVFGGNGSGKTCSLAAILLPGICLGPDFVNKDFCNWEYFYEIEKIRRKRKLLVRLVADAADMKEGSGSLHQQIVKWIPTAQFSDKAGDFYKTITIGDVKIDFKSHAMPKITHAGPDYDVVIFNEPVPDPEIYDENIARTRGRGRAFMFCTPLDMAAYLAKETEGNGPDGEVSVGYISLWDNCSDIPGTRGQYSRNEIETLIRGWQRDPDSLPARVEGKFQHLAGTIFKTYNEDIHVIDPFPIDDSFNLYHICDPHMVKPPFALWVAVDAIGRAFVVAEYPNDDWSTLKSTGLTIKHFVADFDLVESGRNPDFPYMKKAADFNLGDPNIMGTKLPNTNRTMEQEYELYSGRDYDCKITDSNELGFDALKELLYWNNQQPMTASNAPKLFIFRSCKNTRRALREFGIKRSKDQSMSTADRIDPTWECPIACLKYFAVKKEPWESTVSSDNNLSEWDRIERGRNGYGVPQETFASSF